MLLEGLGNNLKNIQQFSAWIQMEILRVHCAVCICRTSFLMPSGPCGLVRTGAFPLIVPCLGLIPYSKQKYMDRPCTGLTKSYSCLRMARSHWGSNPLSEGITFPAKYVTWFRFKHIQNKSPSRQTFNSGLVPRTVMGDSSQHPISQDLANVFKTLGSTYLK